MVGARINHHSPTSPSQPSELAILTSPTMMDIGSGYVVQSPTGMAQQDQLPSPMDTRGPMPHQIDIARSSHAKMRRKSMKAASSVNSSIKRSASTPNVRGMTTGSDAAMSLAEKRRNKLGYHRTSVACVHCRRRKIRCLLAPDDPQKRCSNCIRLKKECNFFPVDQQPPVERRPRTGSKVDGIARDTSTSSSSSPSMPTTHHGDHGEHFNYAHMPMSAHPFSTSHAGPLSATTMSPPGSAAPIHTRFEVPEHPPGVGWDPRFFDGQQIPTGQAGPEEHSGGYWKVPEPPMTPSFSPYSSGPPSSMFHNGSFSSYSSAPSRAESGWQPQPLRAMSFGSHLEDQHHRNDSYPAPYQHDMRRSTVDMLPPSSYSSAASSSAPMADSPISTGPPPTSQSMMHYGSHQGSWNAVPAQSPKTIDFASSGWYQEPNQLSKVQEEDVAHFPDHSQPPLYASTRTH